MRGIDLNTPSSYLRYLPEIYQQGADQGAFIGRYLKIFEKLLSGIDDAEFSQVSQEGLEQVVDRLHEFFDPATAPRTFLDWLAGWMALTLRDNWEEWQKRRFIKRMLSLYRLRGTKKGLEDYLTIYVGAGGVEITEVFPPFQVGVTSTIGKNSFVEGGPPHFFIVTITLTEPNPSLLPVREAAVRAILDHEKPAHTYYQLTTIIPTMRVGCFSTIGKDTLLGDPQEGELPCP